MNNVCLSEKLSLCLDDFSPEIVLGLPEYKYEVAADRFVARYYDATIGRFISADTIVPNPANPQSLNRYSYCLNNPLKYIDPSGHRTKAEQDAAQAGLKAYAAALNDGVSEEQAGAIGRHTIDSHLTIATASTPLGMYLNAGGQDAGIDSDWGDMLEDAEWGDTFSIEIEGKMQEIQLVRGRGLVWNGMVLDTAGTMLATSALKNIDSMAELHLPGVDSFKLNDGQGWFDRNGKWVAVGGIVVVSTALIAFGGYYGYTTIPAAYAGFSAATTTTGLLVGGAHVIHAAAGAGVVIGGGILGGAAAISTALEDVQNGEPIDTYSFFESLTVSAL